MISHALAKAFRDHASKATRVWIRTRNGWASREVTQKDKERWEQIAKEYEGFYGK